MKEFKVIVKALLPNNELHEYDKDVAGEYSYKVLSKDEALDIFHSTIPIKVLDDFEITVK